MKAEEIRSKVLVENNTAAAVAFGLEILLEIAAQLADLNQTQRELKALATVSQGTWTKVAPTEPGWYWYRDVSGTQVISAEYGMGYDDPEQIVFTTAGSGDGFDGEIMLRHGGEFWSEKLEEPK